MFKTALYCAMRIVQSIRWSASTVIRTLNDKICHLTNYPDPPRTTENDVIVVNVNALITVKVI